MVVLSKGDAFNSIGKIRSGAVFIYPTDTIYGIGCDALNSESVLRIRALKGREIKPFSVIAPSLSWIFENCVVSPVAKEWLSKLPGPYTFILPLKKQAVAKEVCSGSIGVRIPNHWISELVNSFGKPIVTTSVNKSGFPFLSELKDLESFGADFVIFDGPVGGSPSSVIDLTGAVAKQLR